MFIPGFLVSLGLAARPSAVCTREMLKEATGGYLEALAAGKTAFSALSSGTAPYQENDVVMDISKGVMSQGIQIDFNRSLYDTTLCASYTEIVATTKHPYVIGTRLAFTDGKVTKIESNVCDDGDWLFNATTSLSYNNKETWDPIPESKRDSRKVIKAAGDAYIDAWGDSSVQPPFNPNCTRLEGGLYVTGNCKLNFPPPFNGTNRRYTIDEELGAVDIFHNFPFLDKALPEGPRHDHQQFDEGRGGPDSIHSREHCLFQKRLREVMVLIPLLRHSSSKYLHVLLSVACRYISRGLQCCLCRGEVPKPGSFRSYKRK